MNSGVQYPGTFCPEDCPLKSKPFDARNILVYKTWILKTKNRIPFEIFQTQKLRMQKELSFHALNPNIKML
ncbi:hypothetical protein MSBRW_2503 [Methanosarcina barkeri str. Wiesmoor]|uniref:Uncharacterized protein n=2 Tax=Methanosarcina barkeri TaxID=2208 RepID=A0A0E3LLS0_METBA|nr:hypothetical protein MSBRW_2503 [Methanosarcina barkeri str. Wiesmoor]